MICHKCGSEVSDGKSQCDKCGNEVLQSDITQVRSSIQASSEITFAKNEYYKRIREFYRLFELNAIIQKEKKRVFKIRINNKIIEHLKEKITSTDNANELIDLYKVELNADLIEVLKDLSTNYKVIESYLSPFVEFKVVEKTFPHRRVSIPS